MFLAIIYIAYKEELDKILFYEKKAKKLINETIQKNTQQVVFIKTKNQEKKLLEAQLQDTRQKLKLIDQELITYSNYIWLLILFASFSTTEKAFSKSNLS